MTSWIVILAAAFGSYLLRLSMLSLLAGRRVPEWVDRLLATVRPAAVGAIAAGMLLVDRGHPSLAVDPRLVAATVGFLTVRRTGRMADSLLVGFPVLWILTAVGW